MVTGDPVARGPGRRPGTPGVALMAGRDPAGTVPDPAGPGCCPGQCNGSAREAYAAWRKALAVYEQAAATWAALPAGRRGMAPARPEPPVIARALGDPVWCARCVARIRSALAEIDDLAALLAANIDGHSGGRGAGTGRISGSAEPPSPSPAVDLLDALYGALVDLEDHWRARRRYPPRPSRAGRPGSRGAHARTRTISWLLGQLDAMLAQPDSARLGADVLAWRHRLQRATSSAPERRRREARCPKCARRALRTRDDGDIRCGRCGHTLTEDEYGGLVEMQARAATGG